jgi:hypothetical protein
LELQKALNNVSELCFRKAERRCKDLTLEQEQERENSRKLQVLFYSILE